jgi:hypothetical protein
LASLRFEQREKLDQFDFQLVNFDEKQDKTVRQRALWVVQYQKVRSIMMIEGQNLSVSSNDQSNSK